MARTRLLRASDAEREQVVAALRRAAISGRLGFEEFERRLEAALAAQSVVELSDLVYDLPVAPLAPGRRSLAERAAGS